MALTGLCEPGPAAERTAGAVERSRPGSLLQQEPALRTGPAEGGADMQAPQLDRGAGIFMPQLIPAAWQGKAPARTNARRTSVAIERFMGLSCMAAALYTVTPLDAPGGPRDSGLPPDIGRRPFRLEAGCPIPGAPSRYSMVAPGRGPEATGGAGTTACP